MSYHYNNYKETFDILIDKNWRETKPTILYDFSEKYVNDNKT